MDAGMLSEIEYELGAPIVTEEQAKNWVMSLVDQAEELRRACNFAATVKEQRVCFLRWLIKRGEALGALYALRRTSRLQDVVFDALRSRVKAMAVPTVQVGVLPF